MIATNMAFLPTPFCPSRPRPVATHLSRFDRAAHEAVACRGDIAIHWHHCAVGARLLGALELGSAHACSPLALRAGDGKGNRCAIAWLVCVSQHEHTPWRLRAGPDLVPQTQVLAFKPRPLEGG
jgi:hypothetical protein